MKRAGPWFVLNRWTLNEHLGSDLSLVRSDQDLWVDVLQTFYNSWRFNMWNSLINNPHSLLTSGGSCDQVYLVVMENKWLIDLWPTSKAASGLGSSSVVQKEASYQHLSWSESYRSQIRDDWITADYLLSVNTDIRSNPSEPSYLMSFCVCRIKHGTELYPAQLTEDGQTRPGLIRTEPALTFNKTHCLFAYLVTFLNFKCEQKPATADEAPLSTDQVWTTKPANTFLISYSAAAEPAWHLSD